MYSILYKYQRYVDIFQEALLYRYQRYINIFFEILFYTNTIANLKYFPTSILIKISKIYIFILSEKGFRV